MRSFVAAGIACAFLSLAGPAFAGDPSVAEHLFRQGLDAMKQNRFKEACDAFFGSNEADPSPGTQINLAVCHEKQNKLATAWGWYRTAAGSAEQRGQRDRAELARTEASKLEPKLPKLVVTIKAPAEGLTVTRDGVPMPAATLGMAVPVDAGEHVLEVTAKGKKAWKHTITIAAAPGTERVEVPPLEDSPRETASDGAAPVFHDAPIAPARDGSTQRTVGFVLGATGIAAGVTAIVLEMLALAEEDKSKDFKSQAEKVEGTSEADQATRQSYLTAASSRHDAAKSNQLGAIITGAGAVVLLGVGTTLVLTAPSKGHSATIRRPLVVPFFGQGSAGASLVGTF